LCDLSSIYLNYRFDFQPFFLDSCKLKRRLFCLEEQKATKVELGNIHQIITQQNNRSISLEPQSQHVTSRQSNKIQMNNPKNIQPCANTEDGVLVSQTNETSIVDSKSGAIDKCNLSHN
jgi:hypothetical protein